MLSHYVDINIRPDPEFTEATLMSALLGKFHRALAQLPTQQVGISFPGYSLSPKTLGGLLRLHANQSLLQALMASPWLSGMKDHIELSDIALVPEGVAHCVFTRKQFKTNVDRLRRRRMKRKAESYEEAARHLPEHIRREPELPFVTMRSLSTRKTFRLFIEKSETQIEVHTGEFNSYGLSSFGFPIAVPWF